MKPNVNMMNGKQIQQRILTVSEFAAQLQSMIEQGQGDLPVFASDVRARYPMATVVPYTTSGYPECLLIQPQPHLHAEVKGTKRWPSTYFQHVNEEADQIRASCGAFA